MRLFFSKKLNRNFRKIQKIYFCIFRDSLKWKQEFPIPDTLNKRVKKLIQVILKYEGDNGKIEFGNTIISDEEIDQSWSMEER